MMYVSKCAVLKSVLMFTTMCYLFLSDLSISHASHSAVVNAAGLCQSVPGNRCVLAISTIESHSASWIITKNPLLFFHVLRRVTVMAAVPAKKHA